MACNFKMRRAPSEVLLPSPLVSGTAQQRPGAYDALLAGFPVRVFGFQGEACLDGEVEAGLVREPDGYVVMVDGSRELYFFDGLAFGWSKVEEFAVRKAHETIKRTAGLSCSFCSGVLD